MSVFVGEIKDDKLRIGTTEFDVYNPDNKTKVPDVLFYENAQVCFRLLRLLLECLNIKNTSTVLLDIFCLRNCVELTL